MPQLQQRLIDDDALVRAQHIQLLSFGMCDGTTLGIVVAVADETSVSWLRQRYHDVKVVGWLKPVPSGP